ncbi:MAG: FHA domain-containing protein [Bdellovibrionales bacterium]|nr:FHA domain-containing protein [Bdellovibrionales bacterium]
MARFELRARDGKKIAIEREWMRFGRADDNDLVVRDATVSRYHLNFYIKDGRLIVEDAGSQNGFMVNGQMAAGAVALSLGDRILVGNSEYSVQDPDAPEAPSPMAAAAPLTSASYTAFKSKYDASPNQKRFKLYAYGGVALVLFAIALKNNKKEDERAPASVKDEATTALPSAKDKNYRTKSETEILSEAKFREAMRDYDNGNYNRALQGFQESQTLNTENEDAVKYIELTEIRLGAQITDLQKDANASMKNLQYRRAKGQAARVLTILSEQIPGYGRKIAQESSSANNAKHVISQEETLLKIPCEQTREQKSCEEALAIILEARRQLGEENTLK